MTRGCILEPGPNKISLFFHRGSAGPAAGGPSHAQRLLIQPPGTGVSELSVPALHASAVCLLTSRSQICGAGRWRNWVDVRWAREPLAMAGHHLTPSCIPERLARPGQEGPVTDVRPAARGYIRAGGRPASVRLGSRWPGFRLGEISVLAFQPRLERDLVAPQSALERVLFQLINQRPFPNNSRPGWPA